MNEWTMVDWFVAALVFGLAVLVLVLVMVRGRARRNARALERSHWRASVTRVHVPPRSLPPRAPPTPYSRAAARREAVGGASTSKGSAVADDWASVDIARVVSAFGDSDVTKATFRAGGGESAGAGASGSWPACDSTSSGSSSSSSSSDSGSSSCGGGTDP